ncbi:MAG TPA: diguanylate cyclase [Burkholderiales bacterium]|nr:diguanylate cyclase [Burkholderiales bacterium]
MDTAWRETPPTTLSGSLSYAGQVAVLAVTYFAAAKLALLAANPPVYATAVWPSSGIALASVVLFGNRVWPGIWLGAALVNITLDSSLFGATLMGAGNTLEALAGAALVRRYLRLPGNFERGEDVVEFFAIAGLSSTLAATAALAPLALVHSLAPEALPWHWWTRWQADAMGIVIVAPLILSSPVLGEARWPLRKVAEIACLALAMLAVTYTIFSDGLAHYLPSLPLTFAILPFVIWAALRFGQREVVSLNALVCTIAIWQTIEGQGPFAGESLNASLLLLLAFTCTVASTGLVLNAVVGERSRAIEALAQALKTLKEETLRDPLTGLYNRRFLRDYLDRELIRAKREGIRVAVIMIDLDHFKRVNDTAGHAAGDLVLTRTAALLKRHIRGSDIACRYGGEEFTLVLPNATFQSARSRSEAICAAIREQSDNLLGVTASLGVAIFPDHAEGPDSVLLAADNALYEAKGRGRNQVRMFAHRPAEISAIRAKSAKRANGSRIG